MKKILVTGGLGFIGSHAITSLLDMDYDIFCIDNCSNANLNIISRINKISSKPFIFRKISIADQSLGEFIDANEIDSVIHFAGLKSVGESINFPAKYFYNNVIGSKILLDNLKKYKIKNFIFSSSATVYGNPLFLPLKETHPIRATNPYGQNKIDIENMIINDSYFQTECSVKILRYFNPIGAHSSGILGESPIGIPNNLMPYILNVSKKVYSKLMIFGDDYNTHDGTGVRDYIHVMDLVQGHIKAIQYNRIGISIFNLGTGQGYSVLDLLSTFEKVNGIKIPFKIIDRRPGDVDSVFADPSKAGDLLKFKATRNLEEMCHDSWNFARRKN